MLRRIRTTVAIAVIATLIFGRLYCSVVCPLGIFQDFFNWLSKKFDKKKKYGYKPEQPWLRYGVLAVLVIAWLCGFTFLVGLAEPYSAYGRMADELFRPVYLFGNNLLTSISEMLGNYKFFKVVISLKSLTAFAVAVLTLLVIGHFSYHHGAHGATPYAPSALCWDFSQGFHSCAYALTRISATTALPASASAKPIA